MPLNRLTVRETDYPQTDDALPMVTKLQYAERFDKAMRYIFGGSFVCRDLEEARRVTFDKQGHFRPPLPSFT